MPTPQPGVFAQGTRDHYHLEFDLRPGAEEAAVADAVARLRATGFASREANLVIGFGSELWRRLAPDGCPGDAAPFPEIPGVPGTQHDLWVWAHGTGVDSLFEGARLVNACLADVAHLAQDVRGFVYRGGRDLTGFEDGTENPAVNDALDVALIPAGHVGAGGTFAITQRWVHDLEGFEALGVPEQEGVIGRTKLDSVELADAVKPPTAHIARVVIAEDGTELEIYRRSAPYGNLGELGLYFVAFSCDPTRFEKMLRRMFDPSIDGLTDRLTDFTAPVTGSYYFVPSQDSLQGLGARPPCKWRT